MAKNNKTNKQKKVPHTIKTFVSLVEVVARFLAAYLILNNFEHIVAVVVGWYFLVTASMIFVAVFHKAFKK